MSLIKDVKQEVKELDLSARVLRRGSATLGLACFAVGILIHHYTSYELTGLALQVFGVFLTLVAFLAPLKTIDIYKAWMTIALILGWFVSKIVFTVIFYLVITPVGFVAKLFRKEFLDLNFNKKRDSYWVQKTDRPVKYEKMH